MARSVETGHRGSGRDAVRRELQSLNATVDATVEHLPDRQAVEVARLLRETDRSIQTLLGLPDAGTDVGALAGSDLDRYFPVAESPFGRSVADADLDLARQRWAAMARGRSYRARALELIGPLLTPSEVADCLGISVTTVNNWRHRDKILGVRFDDHQYLYPVWQFVTSPADGASGVLNDLDAVLRCLGPIHPWEKARYFLDPQPLFGGRAPLEVLRRGVPAEIEHLKDLASRRGEIGA